MIPRKGKNYSADIVNITRWMDGGGAGDARFAETTIRRLTKALEFVQGERDYWKQQCEEARND